MSHYLIFFKLIINFKSLVLDNNLFIAFSEENRCKLLNKFNLEASRLPCFAIRCGHLFDIDTIDHGILNIRRIFISFSDLSFNNLHSLPKNMFIKLQQLAFL